MRRTTVSGDLSGNGRSDLAYWRNDAVFYKSPALTSLTRSLASSGPISLLRRTPTETVGSIRCGSGRPPANGEAWVASCLQSSGGAGDVLVPGDYDADGVDDLAVWRPSTGTWYVRNQFS
jgi:hypothetical protein